MHAAALQDHEERPESHDDVPGGQELFRGPLQLVASNHQPLEALREERLSRLSAVEAGRQE